MKTKPKKAHRNFRLAPELDAELVTRAAKHLGFEDGWPQDLLRHSAASYWLADTKDVGAVARELGNSPVILLNHYYEIVTAESAVAFWNIRP